MALSNSTSLITSGLAFHLDMNNAKSYKGAPTTNFAANQNPRIDTSYSTYTNTSSGTWPAKHPDAIRVYGLDGSEISNYVNTGVTDYTNTYHAIWVYDYELDKPVVLMRDLGNGEWMAKSWGTGYTYTSMGFVAGSTYTISWLQWTTDITKSANAGLYSNIGFGDGQSNAQGTSYNTLVRTWQRVYATFTVNGTSNLASGISAYMYGHYGPRGMLKIADVQIEAGTVPSRYNNGLTRSSSQAIVDLTGTSTVTATSLTYSADNTFSFNGTSNYLFQSNPTLPSGAGNKTIICWCWPDSTGPSSQYTGLVAYGNRTGSTPADAILLSLYTSGTTMYVSSAYWNNDYTPNNVPVTANAWNMVGMIARAAATTNNTTLFCGNTSGISYTTGSSSNYARGLSTASTNLTIGCTDAGGGRFMKGRIAVVMIYNRELTTAEIQNIFNSYRGRFGI